MHDGCQFGTFTNSLVCWCLAVPIREPPIGQRLKTRAAQDRKCLIAKEKSGLKPLQESHAERGLAFSGHHDRGQRADSTSRQYPGELIDCRSAQHSLSDRLKARENPPVFFRPSHSRQANDIECRLPSQHSVIDKTLIAVRRRGRHDV